MLLRIVFFLILLGWPALLVAADWEQAGSNDEPINLEADQLDFDQQSGRYRASGNVLLQRDALEIRSETLWWDQGSGEIEAAGEVQVTSPDERLEGSQVNYNLQSGAGLLTDGYIFLREPNLHVYGQRIERRGEFDYRIENGTFTTCDGDVPSWKFGADRLDVTLGGYARAKNAVFYLKDIPSFYLPYIIYPAKTERESGLLVPRIGYSEKRGFQYNGAYYQVLGINQDATLNFDLLSEMGVGTGLEYRYVFGRDNAGLSRAYYIDVNQVDGETVDEERYAFEWQHDGKLPGRVRMVADALYVNDEEYFEDFGEVAQDYNKDKVESVFALSRSWGKNNLVAEFLYTKDLETDSKTTLQRLPRVSFDINRQRIGSTPFYYQLETEYTNFWREETTTTLIRGERLMLQPSLEADLQLFNAFTIAPELSYLERSYWGLSDHSDNQEEGLTEFSTRVSTRLQRVFSPSLGSAAKLRHSIEPEVTYRYVPELEQSHLPYFDSMDWIDQADRLEYALVQRLTARYDRDNGSASYRDLLYWRLSQNYYLGDEVHYQGEVVEGDTFSNLRSQMTVRPTSWARVSADTTLDVDQGVWEKLLFETVLQGEQANFKASYRKDVAEELEYADLQLDVAFLKPFYLNYEKRYDLAEHANLEDVVGIEYRQQCWSALLTYRDNDNDRSIILTFSMKGIGPVGGASGNLGGI